MYAVETANGLIGTHLIPHEIDRGIPQIAAASLLGVMGALNMVGNHILRLDDRSGATAEVARPRL